MPFLDFLKKLFSVQEAPLYQKKIPIYWDSQEGEIIRAIILDGNQSWTRLHQNTGFDENTLNYYLGKLMRERIINKSNRYWVQSDVAEYYKQFYYDSYIKNNPVQKNINFIDEKISEEDKNNFIESLKTSNIRGVRKLLTNKQLFLDGRPLGLVTRDLVHNAKKEIIIVNPFVTECSLTENIKMASAYKRVFLLTRPPEFETDFKFYEKAKCHGSLKESGVKIAYNRGVHAKIMMFDRTLCVVSSMNLYHDSSEGLTYEAGLVTMDGEVVNYILESVKKVLSDERTGLIL